MTLYEIKANGKAEVRGVKKNMPNKFTTRIESQTKAELERQARERKLKKRAAGPAAKQEQENSETLEPIITSERQTPDPQHDATHSPTEDTPESELAALEQPDEHTPEAQRREPAEVLAVETVAPPEPGHEPDTPQPQQRPRAKAPRQKSASLNPGLLQGFVIQDEGRRAKNKTFYLDEQVIDAIKQAAADKNVTESRLVNDIFRQLLGLR